MSKDEALETVEQFFSQFKEEGKIWPDGLVVKLRNGSFDKVFSVMPFGSIRNPDRYCQSVIGYINSFDCSPDSWSLKGRNYSDEKLTSTDIVEVYSARLWAKTEDKDEQATD